MTSIQAKNYQKKLIRKIDKAFKNKDFDLLNATIFEYQNFITEYEKELKI